MSEQLSLIQSKFRALNFPMHFLEKIHFLKMLLHLPQNT